MCLKTATAGYAALVLCVAGAAAARAVSPDYLFGLGPGTLSAGAGFDYGSGNYGTSRTTDITALMLTGRYDANTWTLKLTLPYLWISGGTTAVPGVGSVSNTNPRGRGRGTTTTTTASGTSASG